MNDSYINTLSVDYLISIFEEHLAVKNTVGVDGVTVECFANNLLNETEIIHRKVSNQSLNEYVNVDGLNPGDLSLDMFEPITLIGGRARVLSYYGYDYLGNSVGSDITFDDFFKQKDADGRFTRPIAPLSP